MVRLLSQILSHCQQFPSDTLYLAIEHLAVHYDSQTYNLYPNLKYAGPPDPKIDEVWRELLAPMDIRVTKE
jgi:hypothetical protein